MSLNGPGPAQQRLVGEQTAGHAWKDETWHTYLGGQSRVEKEI
jgi:hypothetical protein